MISAGPLIAREIVDWSTNSNSAITSWGMLFLTAGQRGDSPQFEPVLNAIGVPRPGVGRPGSRPLRVRGDKAYSSRANRA